MTSEGMKETSGLAHSLSGDNVCCCLSVPHTSKVSKLEIACYLPCSLTGSTIICFALSFPLLQASVSTQWQHSWCCCDLTFWGAMQGGLGDAATPLLQPYAAWRCNRSATGWLSPLRSCCSLLQPVLNTSKSCLRAGSRRHASMHASMCAWHARRQKDAV